MKIAITMPGYNEEGIVEFLKEISENLFEFNTEFFVVNDKSTNSMESDLIELKNSSKIDLKIYTNDSNLGHGPSTILGLRLALKGLPDIVIAVDGDGQFIGSEIRECLDIFIENKVDVLEGYRRSRTDPKYRRISTFSTKLLVAAVSGKIPKDANTPFRIYDRRVLELILNVIDSNLLTPNLFISSFCRVNKFKIFETKMTSIARRGIKKQGTTWNNKILWVPNKKFIVFCTSATSQWFSVILPTVKKIKNNN